MSDYEKISSVANEILKKYDLCDSCLGRLYSKQLHRTSNKRLGIKLRNKDHKQKCYICKDLFENLNHFLKSMINTSANYYFESFNIGAILKPSIVDKDDFIRSRYQLKGVDSIKTSIIKELEKLFSRKTKTVTDFKDPQMTMTINFKDDSCQLRSKSVTIYGRYVKLQRDIAQKQKSCNNCAGKGCRICSFHGICEFDSVEGIISKFLFEKLGGTVTKFSWIGGEEKSSLVLGSGRPFFVKLQNPNKQNFKTASKDFGPIQIHSLKRVARSPDKPIKFYSTIKAKISTQSNVSSLNLKKLKNIAKQPVIVYDKSGKRFEKKISHIRYKKATDTQFFLFFKSEGGIPIKRFILGEDVTPGIAQILDVKCSCDEIDFLDVMV